MPGQLTVRRAQRALRGAALQLKGVKVILEEVHRDLPLPPDVDDRLEGELPYNAATDIIGSIECVLHDDIKPAIRSLRAGARSTDAKLRLEFNRRERWL